MLRQVFIGYDSREDDAYRVCQFSLRDSGIPLHKLEHRALRSNGYFHRPWMLAGNGQWTDMVDGKPFSTEFSHSRFIVPRLARDMGLKGHVLYCDCDFMFMNKLDELEFDETKAVSVVKHHMTIKEGLKMDGMVQQSYPRKLWSSLIVFNIDHPSNRELDLEEVNTKDGSWLHGFNWLLDSEIGELDHAWNWIPGHSPDGMRPKAVHFSFGGPWLAGYENVPYADAWRKLNSLSRL